jgi:hypothetical protein
MDIVGAFDVHRKQITFDYIEVESGELHRGKIQPANRQSLREWLESFVERFPGKQTAIAVEASTGFIGKRRYRSRLHQAGRREGNRGNLCFVCFD